MSRFKEVVEVVDEMNRITLNTISEFSQTIQIKKFAISDSMEADLLHLKQNGILTCTIGKAADDNEETTAEKTEPKKRGRTKQRTIAARSSSLKENSEDRYPKRSRATGQKKTLGENNNLTPNGILPNAVVKIEKLSEEHLKTQTDSTDIPIKQERTDMPPPTMRPIRQTRKRKGIENLQVKEELIDAESKKRKQSAKSVNSGTSSVISRDSDVQITPEPVDTVNLVETDEEDTEKAVRPRGRPKTKRKVQKKDTNSSTDEHKNEVEEMQPTRVTRTKARTIVKNKEIQNEQEFTGESQKRVNSTSTEEEEDNRGKKASKRTKAKKVATNKKNEDSSIYEDAVSDAEKSTKNHITTDSENTPVNNQNATRVEPHAAQIMNETVVLSKPVVEKSKNPVLINETIVINKLQNGKNGHNVLDELMTDDEEIVVSPVILQKQRKVKQVFSPYANSPVKKRVEAFEKLGAESNADLPPRMTRTKTKAKEQENASSENESPVDPTPVPVKYPGIPKLKITPLAEHRAKLKLSQSAKITAVKVSQAEFRERELRRKQKEEEASSKKEALIQAQTEERRRKREERQLKAQQQREALEKEKQKTQESAERIKQEKIKQLKAEKEEKLLKQREEAARKRAHALKKALEEKKKEQKRVEEDLNRTTNLVSKAPLYLRYETPLLPTEDCYDSDDSHSSKPFTVPNWQKKDYLLKTLRWMRYTESFKRLFFNNGPQTVNLKEIFPSIEPHKLKRTSSAIWNRSGLPILPPTVEEDE